jgi:hypothetical protein
MSSFGDKSVEKRHETELPNIIVKNIHLDGEVGTFPGPYIRLLQYYRDKIKNRQFFST